MTHLQRRNFMKFHPINPRHPHLLLVMVFILKNVYLNQFSSHPRVHFVSPSLILTHVPPNTITLQNIFPRHHVLCRPQKYSKLVPPNENIFSQHLELWILRIVTSLLSNWMTLKPCSHISWPLEEISTQNGPHRKNK